MYTIKWGNIEQFSLFFIKLITLTAWLQYYKLKPPQALFSECENNCFIVHAFCQINATKVVQSHPIKMEPLWTKRDFMARKIYLKFPQIFPARRVNICDMHKSNRCFWVSLDMLGEIKFLSKLRFRASIFFIWKL